MNSIRIGFCCINLFFSFFISTFRIQFPIFFFKTPFRYKTLGFPSRVQIFDRAFFSSFICHWILNLKKNFQKISRKVFVNLFYKSIPREFPWMVAPTRWMVAPTNHWLLLSKLVRTARTIMKYNISIKLMIDPPKQRPKIPPKAAIRTIFTNSIKDFSILILFSVIFNSTNHIIPCHVNTTSVFHANIIPESNSQCGIVEHEFRINITISNGEEKS